MSNQPADIAEQIEMLKGRVDALEVLAGQSWVFLLAPMKDSERDPFIEDAITELERRLDPAMSATAKILAVEVAETVLHGALAAIRQLAPGDKPPKGFSE